MATTNILPTLNPMLRRPVVEQAIGEKRSTIYRKIKLGLFPKPVQIGGERVAWPANEVQAIIDARIAGESDENIKALVSRLHAARTQKQGSVCVICQEPTPAVKLESRGLCSTCAAYNHAGQGDKHLLSLKGSTDSRTGGKGGV